MCLRNGADPMVGPEGWKVEGGLLEENIKTNLDEMEGVWARNGFIMFRIETGVGLLCTR